MDFTTFRECAYRALTTADVIPSLPQGALHFAINAPDNYHPPTSGDSPVLYLDKASRLRPLPPNGYQIRCTHDLGFSEFEMWSARAVKLIHWAFMQRGITSIDLSDLLGVLRACKSKQLVFDVLPYHEQLQTPYIDLSQRRFKNLVAVIFSDEGLTLNLYSDLIDTLEGINPEINLLVTAATYYEVEGAVVMLLGEAE